VKFEASVRFWNDYRRLNDDERHLFLRAVREMNAAFAGRGDQPLPHWPATLRIKRMRDAPGIFEMTWSFSGPDGRATFELITIDGEPAVLWRRIGDHKILTDP
jgi:hypothetical protein